MQRDFYYLGILFLSLYVIGAVFQSILFFQIEYEVYRLHSFANWFLVVVGTALVGLIYMLKYYHHQGYRAVFITGIIVMVASLCQNVFFYAIVLRFIRELQPYYLFAVYFSLGASLLYAISLVFSRAGHNPWLKGMGIYVMVMGGISIYLLILSLQAVPGPVNNTVIQLSKWVNLGISLEFVPMIILFYGKYKSFKSDSEDFIRRKSPDYVYALGGIAVLMMLVFGVKIYTQSYYKSHVSPQARTLAEPFEARTYTNPAGKTLLYRLLKPQDYDPDQTYPMVVCLHGGAGWGTDNFRNIEGSLFARELSKPANRKQYPAFLFVPQCPPRASWGGLPNLPEIDTLVFEVINSLEQEFAIDTNRMYVAGHSLGGYGTWHFIGTRPEKFAAAIPVAGEGNPALAPNMLNVAIWAFHGANDQNVPVSGSRDVIEAIKKAGGDPRYTESPDGGHGWEIVTHTPGVFKWLFAQKRD